MKIVDENMSYAIDIDSLFVFGTVQKYSSKCYHIAGPAERKQTNQRMKKKIEINSIIYFYPIVNLIYCRTDCFVFVGSSSNFMTQCDALGCLVIGEEMCANINRPRNVCNPTWETQLYANCMWVFFSICKNAQVSEFVSSIALHNGTHIIPKEYLYYRDVGNSISLLSICSLFGLQKWGTHSASCIMCVFVCVSISNFFASTFSSFSLSFRWQYFYGLTPNLTLI